MRAHTVACIGSLVRLRRQPTKPMPPSAVGSSGKVPGIGVVVTVATPSVLIWPERIERPLPPVRGGVKQDFSLLAPIPPPR